MNVLLFNAGSSSLKATLAQVGSPVALVQGQADWAGAATHYEFQRATDEPPRSEVVPWKGYAAAVARFLQDLARELPAGSSGHQHLAGVGHRVVHGGEFTSSVRVTPEVRSRIEALSEVAPLHNPPSLEVLRAVEAALPRVPQVAIFDTAFHSTLPPEAYVYPLPAKWQVEWKLRRYGFHGLSHAYCSRRAAEMLGRPARELRLVICHLGHGCSATAVRGGRSLDTTMGFTPLAGLMMATRSGSVDPGLILHVQQQHGLSPHEVEIALNHDSGLLGVSQLSADMREVLQAANEGHAASQLALAIYTHRVRQAIGALGVTLGGIDALIFTAGVGEHASEIRRLTCQGLECLGLELDQDANARCSPDADVARESSRGRILVIAAREDLVMREEVERVLGLEANRRE